MHMYPVIDLHTHTFGSDGELGCAELARRAQVNTYSFLGLADHADFSNLAAVVKAAVAAAKSLNGYLGEMTILPGVEITHVPPRLIGDAVKKARDLGATHVVVHGESIVEPVAPATNLAAITAMADILAHPGLLTEKEAALAAENGVYLELSGRGGHDLGNGRVYQLAKKHGAKLLVNSDGHGVGDLFTPQMQKAVALGAGMAEVEFAKLMEEADFFANGLTHRLK